MSYRPSPRRFAAAVFSVLGALSLSAHVGSPDTIWEGMAGSYPIRVIIRDPGVIPGQAEIIVRTKAAGVTGVQVTATVWNAEGSAPPPEVAVRVPGDSTLWSSHLWFMTASSFGVQVIVSGKHGSGTALIPFLARATRVTPLSSGLGGLLALLAALLVAGLVTIVVASVRESTLPPGVAPGVAHQRRAVWSGVLALGVAGWLLYGGKSWWGSEASAYARGVGATAPFLTEASLIPTAAGTKLKISIRDTAWQRVRSAASGVQQRSRWTPLIPDHGKLMHAFLIAEEGSGFAHLHPISTDSITFSTNLPPLPGGRYRLFADVVHESGWSQTLTAVVDIPSETGPWERSDPDDAWTAAGVSLSERSEVGEGLQIAMLADSTPVIVGKEVTLSFRVWTAAGEPATLEPYLGMPGHLALVRDSTVYMHLHPSGTASMAAARQLAAHLSRDTTMATHAMAESLPPGELSFPYVFPATGTYRIWVQVRVGGTIRTAPFRLSVGPSVSKE